jgi:hypothetical protein
MKQRKFTPDEIRYIRKLRKVMSNGRPHHTYSSIVSAVELRASIGPDRHKLKTNKSEIGKILRGDIYAEVK